MTTQVVRAVTFLAVILLSIVRKQQLYAVADGTSENRFYVCDCQEDTSKCTETPTRSASKGNYSQNLNNTRLYRCMCKTNVNCSSQQTSSYLASGSFNLTTFHECNLQQHGLNCSVGYNETVSTNSTMYVTDTNATFPGSVRNTTRNFQCFNDSKGSCLECFDLPKDACTNSMSTAPNNNNNNNKSSSSTQYTTAVVEIGDIITAISTAITPLIDVLAAAPPTAPTVSTTTSATAAPSNSTTAQTKLSTTPTNSTSPPKNSTYVATNSTTDSANSTTDSANSTTDSANSTTDSTNSTTDSANSTIVSVNSTTDSANSTTAPRNSTTTPTTIPRITAQPKMPTAATQGSEELDLKSVIIISVIVGICLLLGVGVCSYLMYQRRKMNINYKRRKELSKNMPAFNNTSYVTDNTHPKTVF